MRLFEGLKFDDWRLEKGVAFLSLFGDKMRRGGWYIRGLLVVFGLPGWSCWSRSWSGKGVCLVELQQSLWDLGKGVDHMMVRRFLRNSRGGGAIFKRCRHEKLNVKLNIASWESPPFWVWGLSKMISACFSKDSLLVNRRPWKWKLSSASINVLRKRMSLRQNTKVRGGWNIHCHPRTREIQFVMFLALNTLSSFYFLDLPLPKPPRI